MKKAIFLISGFLAFGILVCFFIIRPVSFVIWEKAFTQGLVVDIYEDGVKDVVLKLKDDNSSYYINRGLETGMDIKGLKEKLIGNSVELDYHKPSKHIYKLEFNDEILYDERQ